jgi:protein-L-isoaspartate(D-aspartate) O-methyltransferase
VNFDDRRIRLIMELRSHGITDTAVLSAVERVPREIFVPPSFQEHAYENTALPIGMGQTISQPSVVAFMTQALELGDRMKVLEIGTGSGYQAAVLGELVKDLYTIEIVKPLGLEAAAALSRLGYKNVHTRIGDGYKGWPEEAPFDSIIVTAAPDHIPPELITQLKTGGRLVIPVGKLSQDLLVITKNEDGTTSREQIVPVQFVPLTREKE